MQASDTNSDEQSAARLSILLGAGASFDAGLPMTGRLTKALVQRVQTSDYRGQPSQALNFVCSALIGHRGAQGGDPYAELDVERVFSAVQLLAERATHEAAPFVNAWHPAVAAFDRQSDYSLSQQLNQSLANALGGEAAGTNQIYRSISEIARQAAGLSASGKVYRELQTAMLAELCAVLDLTTNNDVSYLRPLAQLATAQGGLDVATLNYDLTVEKACEGIVPVATGVSTEPRAASWEWPENALRLMKLHGSLDWHYVEAPYQLRYEGFLPQLNLLTGISPSANDNPAVVFGERGKVRADGPFLGLLRRFEEVLERTDTLLVVGYSFRDSHINEFIRRWLNLRLGRKLLVLDPGWPERPSMDDFRYTLYMHLIQHGRPKDKPAWP